MVLPPMHRSAKPFPLHHQASKQPNHTKSPWMKQQLGLPGSSDTKTLLCRRREGGREGPQAPSPPAGTGELSVQSAESREQRASRGSLPRRQGAGAARHHGTGRHQQPVQTGAGGTVQPVCLWGDRERAAPSEENNAMDIIPAGHSITATPDSH